MLWAGVAFLGFLQVTAVLLNLLPIPGLDGYNALEPHLSPETQRALEPFKPYGLMLLFFLLFAASAEPVVLRHGRLVLRALRGAGDAGERRHAADPVLERLVLRRRCLSGSCNTCVKPHILLAMGAGHDHANAGTPAPRLAVATALLGGFFIVELTTALLIGSIALLADAGHILTDVAATFMGLCAVILAQRGSTSPGRTYGWHRAEVFTAVANAVLLIGVATIILREAIGRIGHAPEVPGIPMIVVALIGLATNAAVALLLRSHSSQSLAVKGAYMEVIADTVGSIGVLIAGVVTLTTHWPYADVVVAVLVACGCCPGRCHWPRARCAFCPNRRPATSTSRSSAPRWARSTA